jgi:hypothetical protein
MLHTCQVGLGVFEMQFRFTDCSLPARARHCRIRLATVPPGAATTPGRAGRRVYGDAPIAIAARTFDWDLARPGEGGAAALARLGKGTLVLAGGPLNLRPGERRRSGVQAGAAGGEVVALGGVAG